MLKDSLSNSSTNSNPETTQPTNNALPLPASVQIVIDEQFRQLYEQLIGFEAHLLPPRTDEQLRQYQQRCDDFEQRREVMMQELRNERARLHRDTYEALDMDKDELGRELGFLCLLVWDVLLTIAYMERHKATRRGLWYLAGVLYHRLVEPLGNRIFRCLASHTGSEHTRQLLNRAQAAFTLMKQKPKNLRVLTERLRDIFTHPENVRRWSGKRAEDFRPHLERLRAIRAEDEQSDVRRRDRERIKQVLHDVEGLREPLRYEIKNAAKNMRRLNNRDAATRQRLGGVR